MTSDNIVVNLSQIVITGMNSENILLLMSQTMLFVIIFPDTSKLLVITPIDLSCLQVYLSNLLC